jgi:surface antigen
LGGLSPKLRLRAVKLYSGRTRRAEPGGRGRSHAWQERVRYSHAFLISFVTPSCERSHGDPKIVAAKSSQHMRIAYPVLAGVALLCGVSALSACSSGGRDGYIADASATGSLPAPRSVVIGGIATNETGALDARERRIAADAEYRALEYGRSGTPVDWDGSDRRGSIVPGKPYKAGDQYCRPYTHTIYTGESPLVEKATACRSDHGVWRSVG